MARIAIRRSEPELYLGPTPLQSPTSFRAAVACGNLYAMLAVRRTRWIAKLLLFGLLSARFADFLAFRSAMLTIQALLCITVSCLGVVQSPMLARRINAAPLDHLSIDPPEWTGRAEQYPGPPEAFRQLLSLVPNSLTVQNQRGREPSRLAEGASV